MSTYSVTLDQREKIERAIGEATGPGRRSYIGGCVMAKLAAIEGVSNARISGWDKMASANRVQPLVGRGFADELRAYPLPILMALQDEWDEMRRNRKNPNARLLARFHELIGVTGNA